MNSRAASIVLTTIFDPVILESYYDKFEGFGQLEETEMLIIPDWKVPDQRTSAASTWRNAA